MKGGVQSITMNITQMTSPILNVTDTTLVTQHTLHDAARLTLWMQLSSLSYAIRELLLGDAVLESNFDVARTTYTLKDNTQASQAVFMDTAQSSGDDKLEYIWGDVIKGIEEISHNITAALLTLQLGTMNAVCFFDQEHMLYQYTSFALWAPYGVSTALINSSNDLIFLFHLY